MKMEFKIDGSSKEGLLVDQIIDMFKTEVNKTLDENAELIPDGYREKIKVIPITSDIHCISQLTRYVPEDKVYKVQEICDHMKTYMDRWRGKPYVTSTEYDEDPKTHNVIVSAVFILINVDTIANDVLDNITFLDELLDLYKIDAHHEVGHVIDHFLNLHNRSVDEVNAIIKKEDEEYDEYYKWKKNYLDEIKGLPWDVEFGKTITAKYYEIPSEHRADELGKVDRTALIDKIYRKELLKTTNVRIETFD